MLVVVWRKQTRFMAYTKTIQNDSKQPKTDQKEPKET